MPQAHIPLRLVKLLALLVLLDKLMQPAQLLTLVPSVPPAVTLLPPPARSALLVNTLTQTPPQHAHSVLQTHSLTMTSKKQQVHAWRARQDTRKAQLAELVI